MCSWVYVEREREQQMNSIVNLMVMVKRITESWGTSGLLENDGSPQSLVVLLPEDMKESANPLNRTQLQCIVIQCLKYCYLQMWDNRVIFLAQWLPDLFHCISSLYHFCVVPWVEADLWVSSEYFIIVDMLYDSGGWAVLCHIYSLVSRHPRITILVTWNDCRYDLG